VITTILSFDDLLFNVNIRQVMPDAAHDPLLSLPHHNTADKTESNPLSMSNPLYKTDSAAAAATTTGKTPNLLSFSSKYLTKIDAGIRINNLTQEVNMPLLRLVHQIYSIIADAIEYDKEQNKLTNESYSDFNDSVKELKINTNQNYINQHHHRHQPSSTGGIVLGTHNRTGSQQQKDFKEHKDCWRFMAGILELREFIPEPKYVEKVIRFNPFYKMLP
jgi:hypothetical protein